jgi:hypothetical protein
LEDLEAAGHPLGVVGGQVIRRNAEGEEKTRQAKKQAN